MRKTTMFLFILIFAGNLYSQSIDSQEIDSFIKKVRGELNLTTGFTIGVVIGDTTVFTNGYGYSNIEKEIKATPDSPFYIASSTKSFTATLVEMLTENDTLDIDMPISKYLPGYDFDNENLHCNLISMRDLLTHRSGILNFPSVIRTAYTGQHTNEKLFELYKKSSRFTTHQFKYGNDGYVFTSLILDELYKKPWQELMKENLFIPLEMNNTSCKISNYDPVELRAYANKNGQIEELQFVKADNTMHAAGGIVSTANDLCNWLKFNISEGEFNGKQILSRRKLKEMHSSQIGCSVTFCEYKRFAYGLGWYLSDYNNELLIHHFGGYAGARSHISFMPEHNIGVVALTNDDGDGFFVVDLIADYIYNLYLGKDADKIAMEELNEILSEMEKETEQPDTDKEEVVSNYSVNSILGNYYSNEFGEIEIVASGNLQLRFGNLIGELIPSTESQFKVLLGSFNTKIEFAEENNKISQLIFYGPIKIIFDKM